MIFVNEQNQEEFLRILETEKVFVFPVLSFPEIHYVKNRVSFLYFATISTRLEFLVNYYNYDIPKSSLSIERISAKCANQIIYKKKFVKNLEKNLEALILYWGVKEDNLDINYNDCIIEFHRKGINNDLIPIYKWVDVAREIFEKIRELEFEQIIEYDNLVTQLAKVEQNGLCVRDSNFFPSNIGKNLFDGLIYSEYNPYTVTGRPSNHFGGINFAALSKISGIRKNFISRFEDGWLAEFDYHAYHIQLISKLVGYKFPEEDVYKFLAKEYFGKEPTEEQINHTKELTFQQIYGGVRKEFQHIEFFKKLKILLGKIEVDNNLGTCRTFLFKKKISSTENSIKTFNYLLQNLETEVNSIILTKINDFLVDKKSKLILYTYDSFLIDYCPEDGIILFRKLKEILESTGINIKFKIGRNYHTMFNKNI